MKIAVGMSGGVDSSVAALRLMEEGHTVIGIMMKIWSGKASLNPGKHACYSPDEHLEIDLAKKVCETLDIPFHVFDCSADYQAIVLNNFRSEYLLGNTPNPCILCNQKVKFDILVQAAKKEVSFDHFATGHYAQIQYDSKNQRYQLIAAKDTRKDQSYFLYRLSQSQLSETLFPLGSMTKEEVRSIAKKAGLPSSDEEESQDFYAGDYRELLQTSPLIGNIVTQAGKIIGQHEGYWNFTIGQRKGLGVSSHQPLYVLRLVPEKNEVVVGTKEEGNRSSFWVADINWISWDGIFKEELVQIKTRSTQVARSATLFPGKDHNEVQVSCEFEETAVSPGQSAVFYNDQLVLGGGIIRI